MGYICRDLIKSTSSSAAETTNATVIHTNDAYNSKQNYAQFQSAMFTVKLSQEWQIKTARHIRRQAADDTTRPCIIICAVDLILSLFIFQILKFCEKWKGFFYFLWLFLALWVRVLRAWQKVFEIMVRVETNSYKCLLKVTVTVIADAGAWHGKIGLNLYTEA